MCFLIPSVFAPVKLKQNVPIAFTAVHSCPPLAVSTSQFGDFAILPGEMKQVSSCRRWNHTKKRKWSSSLHFPTCKQATHQPASEAWSCWIRESCKRDDLAIFCLKNCHFACARMLASGDSRRVVLLLLIFTKEQQVFELPSKFSKKHMAQNASRFLPNNRTSQMF